MVIMLIHAEQNTRNSFGQPYKLAFYVDSMKKFKLSDYYFFLAQKTVGNVIWIIVKYFGFLSRSYR